MIHTSQCDKCGWRTSQSCGEPPHYDWPCEANSGCSGTMRGLGVGGFLRRNAIHQQIGLYARHIDYSQNASDTGSSADQHAIRGTSIHELMERFNNSAP